jgi:hypothetical protein
MKQTSRYYLTFALYLFFIVALLAGVMGWLRMMPEELARRMFVGSLIIAGLLLVDLAANALRGRL